MAPRGGGGRCESRSAEDAGAYPVFAWLEIAARLEALGDGALATAITAAMNRRRLGDDAPFDLTEDERERVGVVLTEEPRS